MILKRHSKNRLRNAIFGVLFAIMSLFSLTALIPVNNVYAEPTTTTTTTTEETGEKKKGVSCEQSLGALGWLVCPTTGKISEAVDWLYDKIEDILVINPVELKDGAPIYEIWKYMKGLTNIIFIIFMNSIIMICLKGILSVYRR